MGERPSVSAAVKALLDRGVSIPAPWTVDIADDVDPDRISPTGVVLHPGSRIAGSRTVLSAGCEIGAEGPATVVDCRLGPGVELRGGYFHGAVFLAGASMGLGAHVRAGCLLEEGASGAHTVGLKQTILFPWVTLGSLINFCDALMAGGVSRHEHSEVGSSYIHFNFTPDGHKATASLFGDVPRGVMLDRSPIFLGGQGGAVGPVRVGFGSVIGAGSILRADVGDDELVLSAPPDGVRKPVSPRRFKRLGPLVEHNVTYLSNLAALEAWYVAVRRPFFCATDLGEEVYAGALEMLASARAERTKRLRALIDAVPADTDARRELHESAEDLLAACSPSEGALSSAPDALVERTATAAAAGTSYLETIQALPTDVRAAGTAWLQGIVDDIGTRAAATVPAFWPDGSS